MRFSILIPVYNTEKYLPECLVSVLSQTCGDFEAIIIDDGSTDNSPEILDAYAAANPDVLKVIHKENGGLISARREAIARAGGAYCLFLDSDDYLEPDCLESISRMIDQSGADMILFRIRKIYPDCVLELPTVYENGRAFKGDEKKEIYSFFIAKNGFNSLSMKAIRTGLLKNDPTDYSSLSNPKDEDMFQSLYPITEARSIAYLDRLLYNCRVNADSLTGRVGLQYAPELINREALAGLRRMMTVWDMEQPEHIEAFYARQLGEVIDFFCRCFDLAKTAEQKRKVFDYDWFALITPGFEPYLNSTQLSHSRRLRLKWLYRRNFTFMNTAHSLSGKN